jgi:hypothetical protein
MEDFSLEKIKRADIKNWKMAEQALWKNKATPTPPMATIINKYPDETFNNIRTPFMSN